MKLFCKCGKGGRLCAYNAQRYAFHFQQKAKQNRDAWLQCSQMDQDLNKDLVEDLGWDMDQKLDHCLDQKVDFDLDQNIGQDLHQSLSHIQRILIDSQETLVQVVVDILWYQEYK